MKQNYQNLVNKGKAIISRLKELKELENCYQAKIAKYAISVCEIRHGGSSIEKIYTLKDYALDIGMNPKTLQGYVQVYRNVLEKIGLDEPSIDEWRRATKVNGILSMDRIIDNKNAGCPKSRTAYKKEVSRDHVKNLYIGIEEKPFITECNAIISGAKYAKSILDRRDLNIVDDVKLLHLMEILDYNSEIINDHLTNKSRKAVS